MELFACRTSPLRSVMKSDKTTHNDYSEADWKDFYARHCPSTSHFTFSSSITPTLSMIFLVFLRLCPGTFRQSGEWLFNLGDKDEFHWSRFWPIQKTWSTTIISINFCFFTFRIKSLTIFSDALRKIYSSFIRLFRLSLKPFSKA